MKLLFVHQNMPGQYRELLPWLASSGKHQICFLTQKQKPPKIKGVNTITYSPAPRQGKPSIKLSESWDAAAANGLGAVRAAQRLEKDQGFRPDIIIGHAGWGELLYLKDLWNDVPVIGLFEFYYRMSEGLIGFDPQRPTAKDTAYLLRSKNAVHCTALDAVDIGHVPMQWQADQFPDFFQQKFYVCHDGIRTDRLRADPNAGVHSSRLGRELTRQDEVFSFVSRHLERARGFHRLMQALPKIQKERPNARVIIVGGNSASYGPKSRYPGGLRAEMKAKYGDQIDWSRTHFLGNVPYQTLCKIIQISKCHLYLSMPFVLSWSLLESMAMQATVVATDVAPVREVISHRENGLLVDFFDSYALAEQIVDVLAKPHDYSDLGKQARKTVVEKYDFHTKCLPQHISKINDLVLNTDPISIPEAAPALAG